MILVYEIKEQNEETNQISLIELSVSWKGTYLFQITLQITFFGSISSGQQGIRSPSGWGHLMPVGTLLLQIVFFRLISLGSQEIMWASGFKWVKSESNFEKIIPSWL